MFYWSERVKSIFDQLCLNDWANELKLFESTTQQHIEFMVYCGAFLHVRSECSALRMIIFNLEIRHFNVDLLFNAEIVVLRKVASLWLWKATANLKANCLELSYFNKYSTEKKKLNEFLLTTLSYNPLSMISTLFSRFHQKGARCITFHFTVWKLLLRCWLNIISANCNPHIVQKKGAVRCILMIAHHKRNMRCLSHRFSLLQY